MGEQYSKDILTSIKPVCSQPSIFTNGIESTEFQKEMTTISLDTSLSSIEMPPLIEMRELATRIPSGQCMLEYWLLVSRDSKFIVAAGVRKSSISLFSQSISALFHMCVGEKEKSNPKHPGLGLALISTIQDKIKTIL